MAVAVYLIISHARAFFNYKFVGSLGSRAMRDRVTGLASWNYTRSHQCVVFYEPGSDTYLGGSVLDTAEDFLQSVVSRGDHSAS